MTKSTGEVASRWQEVRGSLGATLPQSPEPSVAHLLSSPMEMPPLASWNSLSLICPLKVCPVLPLAGTPSWCPSHSVVGALVLGARLRVRVEDLAHISQQRMSPLLAQLTNFRVSG